MGYYFVSMKNFNPIPMLLLLIVLFSFYFTFASSFEYDVGGSHGWGVPPANDTKIYNEWASGNRFRAGDSIRFSYKKDSVMEVTEEEYKKCNSTHPSFFSNNGNSVFKLDRSGYFYFISGVSGHCPKGQKMIIKVLSADDSSPDADHHNHKSESASHLASAVHVVLGFVLSFVF